MFLIPFPRCLRSRATASSASHPWWHRAVPVTDVDRRNIVTILMSLGLLKIEESSGKNHLSHCHCVWYHWNFLGHPLDSPPSGEYRPYSWMIGGWGSLIIGPLNRSYFLGAENCGGTRCGPLHAFLGFFVHVHFSSRRSINWHQHVTLADLQLLRHMHHMKLIKKNQEILTDSDFSLSLF